MKQDNTKTDVLYENEVNANRIMGVAVFALAIMTAITWILSKLEAFYVYRLGQSDAMFGISISILVASGILCKYFKYRGSWVKYFLMTVMILSLAFFDMIFTYNVPMFSVIPVILSSRYFSGKNTVLISLISFVVFFISAILGVYWGAIDLNNLTLPEGSVISLGENTWLSDAVETGLVEYDKTLVLKNTLLYSYTTKLMQSLLIAAVCTGMSIQGRNLIFKQKNLSEQSARVRAELSMATKIQMDMVPNKFPAFPDRTEFALHASMTPAREVGGDFYDFFFIDPDHLCLVIADVSGKGIPAAMFMMLSKNVLANNAMTGKTPSQILEAANNALCVNNREHMFVTVWLGILELSTGKLTASNAGHECPALMHADGDYELFNDEHGFLLGALPGKKFTDYELELKKGSKIFLYTDGVVEATDANEELFGDDRMISALNTAKSASPEETLVIVRKAVDAFVKEAEQFDDLTMLCVEYKG